MVAKSIQGIIVFAGVLLSLSVAKSQEATVLPVHPGDTLKYEVRFDGVDADKIKRVQIYITTNAGIPADQVTFSNGTPGDPVAPVAPNTFRPDVRIPDNLVTGDYLLYINAFFDPGNIQYASGNQIGNAEC